MSDSIQQTATDTTPGTTPGVTTEVQPQETPAPQATNLDEILTNALSQVKRPDGSQKYATPEAFIQAAVTAQEFIPNILQEKQEMSTTLETLQQQLQTAEAERARLESQLQEAMTLSKPASPQEAPANAGSGLDIDTIRQQVMESIKQEQLQASQVANQQKAFESIQATFGDKAEEITGRLVNEQFNGSVDLFKTLAGSAPGAVAALLNVYKNPETSTNVASATALGAQKPNQPPPSASSLAPLPGETLAQYDARVLKRK